VRRILATADAHYRAADRGIPLLPRSCRFAIRASRLIYSRIGNAIEQNGHDTVTRRAHVSLPHKLALIARAAPVLLSNFDETVRRSTGPADASLARLVAQVGLPVPRALAEPG